MSKYFTLSFLFSILFFAVTANPASPKETLIGGTIMANNKPVNGAVVYLLKDTGNSIVKTTISDNDGKFSFMYLPEKFRIKVNALGYMIT